MLYYCNLLKNLFKILNCAYFDIYYSVLLKNLKFLFRFQIRRVTTLFSILKNIVNNCVIKFFNIFKEYQRGYSSYTYSLNNILLFLLLLFTYFFSYSSLEDFVSGNNITFSYCFVFTPKTLSTVCKSFSIYIPIRSMFKSLNKNANMEFSLFKKQNNSLFFTKRSSSYFTADIIKPSFISKSSAKTLPKSNIEKLKVLAGNHPVIFRRSCRNFKCFKQDCAQTNIKKPPCKLAPNNHKPCFTNIGVTTVAAVGHVTHGNPKQVNLYPLSHFDFDQIPKFINYVHYSCSIPAKRFNLNIDYKRTSVMRNTRISHRLNLINYDNSRNTSKYKMIFLNKSVKPKPLKYMSSYKRVFKHVLCLKKNINCLQENSVETHHDEIVS